PTRADPTGSSNAAGPTRRRGAAACPPPGDALGRRPRRSPWAEDLRRAAQPARRCRRDRPSLVAEYVRALRRIEAEFLRVDLRVALELREAQVRRLAEVVGELHRLQPVLAEAHAHALEAGVALARPGVH